MPGHQGFSVTLHWSHLGLEGKQHVIDHLMKKSPLKAVVGRELYDHQDGSHIHIFYTLKSQSRFQTHLKHWACWWTHGRVQVDAMKGTIEQACKYLMQQYTKKDKLCDPDPWFYPSSLIVRSPAERADIMIDSWLSVPMAEYRVSDAEHRVRVGDFLSISYSTWLQHPYSTWLKHLVTALLQHPASSTRLQHPCSTLAAPLQHPCSTLFENIWERRIPQATTTPDEEMSVSPGRQIIFSG